MRAAERAVKAIYIHSHMDEETFDIERAADCCDSNCYADGSPFRCATTTCCIAKEGSLQRHAASLERAGRWADSHPSLAAHRELDR